MSGQDLRLLPTGIAALCGARAGLMYPEFPWMFVVLAGVTVGMLARRSSTLHLGIAAASLALVAVLAGGHLRLTHPSAPDGRVTVAGTVGEVARTPFGCEIAIDEIAIEGDAISPESRILIQNRQCDLSVGSGVRFVGRLRELPAAQREGMSAKDVAVETLGSPGLMRRVVATISQTFDTSLTSLPSHEHGLILGVALGDTSRLDSQLAVAMKRSQLTHLNAVSGGHISLLVGMAIAALGRRRPRITAICASIAIVALVCLVGAEASVIRAVAMATLVLVALACTRTTQGIASLSAATYAVACADPWLVTSVGFLLSASATLGIILLGDPVRSRMAQRMPEQAAELLAIPIAAQLACTPVLWTMSDRGSIWGAVANALVAPVVTPLTVSGLTGAILSPFVPTTSTILVPARLSATWIAYVAEHTASWPGSSVHIGLAFVVCVAIAVMLCTAHATLTFALIIMASFGCYARGRVTVPTDWTVLQCDVGQGSALIARVNQRIVMIDTGPQGGGVERCIKTAGIDAIDVLVLTHAHADHVGGIPQVLSTVTVRNVWTSPNMEPEANNRWITNELRIRGIEPVTVSRGEHIDGVEIVWPERDLSSTNGSTVYAEADANDDSLAIHLDVLGGVLVTGDQGESAQRRMSGNLRQSRVLIVPHHGSADQSQRLHDAVGASLAIVSVGENTYGHPASKMRNMYSDATILTTKECGAIALNTTGAYSRCDDVAWEDQHARAHS